MVNASDQTRAASRMAIAAVGASAVSLIGSSLAFSAPSNGHAQGRALRLAAGTSSDSLPASARPAAGSLAGSAFGAGAAMLAGAAAGSCRRHRANGSKASTAVVRRARGGAKDYYEILGVSRNANEKDIKASFRKLARQWHPDVNKEPGAQEKFQDIAKAYEVLGDAQKRQRFDQFGEEGVRGGGGPDMSQMNLDDLLGDVFSQFFNGGRGGMGGMGGQQQQQRRNPRGPQKGSDLQCDVEIPFETACFGGEVPVQVRREEPCGDCSGKGMKAGQENKTCRQCNGQGAVMQVMQTPIGVMQTQQVCPACQGACIDPSALCGGCRGKGTKPEVKKVSVKVPAGCASGNQLRVRGEGDKGSKGGPSGDLYIAVKAADSKEFTREGFDVYTESEISAWDAMLGTQVVVNTIDGNAEIKVPVGTQPETRMRIRNRGVPKLGKQGERGDHYVTMKVVVPRTLTDKQAELVKELKASNEKVAS
mmetsp:Transcript_109220/g.348656  ORF Transcript_109220/g.348656 Transcript_109220/m.348656 type:complete len:477 (-) Transcript_109220:248-1678(-)